ncbi:MAG: hypothetical protein M3P06_13190 [Acidobacteriota bacterium]|nr:hypothetical protein [Acidobacteriota bacterium]
MTAVPYGAALAALQETCSPLRDFVCPLYAKHRGQGYLLGTGVPLHLGATSIIVTASHVLAEFQDRCIYTLGHEDVLNLSGERRGFNYLKESTIDVDLGLIVLSKAETAELNHRFSFTYRTDLDEAQPTDDIAFYVLAGYPFTRNKPTPQSRDELNTTALFFVSRRMGSLEDSSATGKSLLVHFSLPAPPDGTKDMTGTLTTPPKPRGMSGGGVWCIQVDASTGRLAMPRLVGIGIEYDHGNRQFVCSRIQYLQPMLVGLIS